MMPYLRTYILFAVLIATASSVGAQIGIGFQAGLSSTILKFGELSRDEAREDGLRRLNSFTLGVPIEIPVNHYFAIQPEINFLRTGYAFKISDDDLGGELNGRIYFNNLEVPLLAKVGYASEQFSVMAVLGPSAAYALNGRAKSEATEIGGLVIPESDEKLDLKEEDVHRLTLSGVAGVQLGIPITGTVKFVLDGRYRMQLNDSNKGNDDPADSARFRTMTATAGVIFSFGR